MAGVPVYLFTASGAYLGQSQLTDGNGQVTFHLPIQAYKVRADYLGQHYWSEVFQWQNATVSIPMGDAEVTVTGSGLPLPGVNVYVFSAAGAYVGVSGTTNGSGKAFFTLPGGTYDFRADYQGGQYWSGASGIVAGQVNSVTIVTLPGTIQVPDVVGLSQMDGGSDHHRGRTRCWNNVASIQRHGCRGPGDQPESGSRNLCGRRLTG